MGTYTYKTTNRTNFKGGSKNSGSHLVGWDNGKVRSERYTFRTGQWPVSKISFKYTSSVYDGKNIAVRCAISTSSTANVNKSGKSGGYAVTKNGNTTISISLKANTTYYIVFYPGVSKSSYGLLNASGNFTITQATIDRLPCSAPTELFLSRTVQTPGEFVELSWSGAAAGTNTQIASYEIFYSTDSTLPDSDWISLGTTTDATTSFNVMAPLAGQTRYYKVQTKSSPAGFDSPLSDSSDGLTGNAAPSAPTIIEISNLKVPSTGGQVKFKVEAGAVTSGTASLYYSTSSTGSKTRFDSPLTVTVTTATTFYFYTYDGTDFSEDVNQAILINTKPQISSVTYDAINTYTALGGNGQSQYQLGYVNEITPKISTTKTGKVKVALEYYSSDATSEWDNTNVQSVPLQEVDITATSNVVLNACHIHKGIANVLKSTNIHWRLSFVLNDGIEDSDAICFPSAGSSEYYAIAHAPSLLARYNQFSNSDITGTKTGEICDLIRLKIYQDTSMTNVSVTAAMGGDNVTVAGVRLSTEDSFQYIDITLDESELIGGADITITANLTDIDGCLTKTVTGITGVKETKKPSLSSPNKLAYGATLIHPFTDTGSFGISAIWPFGTYASIQAALPEYNCSTTATTAIKLAYTDESGTHTVYKAPTWTKDQTNMITSMNREDVYEWNNSLGYQTYVGVKEYRCRLEITNLFGKTYATPWTECKFDFNEPAATPTISKIYWSADKTNWDELDTSSESTEKIQKGMYLKFECDFGLYTTDKVTVSILVKSTGLNERDPHFYDSAEEGQAQKRLTPFTYDASELTRASNRTVGSNKRYYIYWVDTDIKTTDVRQWKIQFISESNKQASSPLVDTKVLKQCPPDIIFNSCKVDKSYKISYKFTIDDVGGGTLRYCLYDVDNEQELSSYASVSTGTTTGDVTLPSGQTWESKNIAIKIESTVTGLITYVEHYYSLAILAYQVTPTVAYRPNSLGINVENPTTGAMVDIHQSSDTNLVLIQGKSTGANPVDRKFVLDVRDGTIKFYSNNVLTSTLDLLNGQIITP